MRVIALLQILEHIHTNPDLNTKEKKSLGDKIVNFFCKG